MKTFTPLEIDVDPEAVSGLPLRPLPDPHPNDQLRPDVQARRRSWQAEAADEAGVPEFGPL